MSTFEEERRAQEAEEYLVLTQTVAILLGGIVLPKKKSEDHWVNTRITITFDDTRSIDLVFAECNNKGKLRVYGCMPKDISNRTIGKHAKGINISTSKTPQQIAKDIQRRFLPEYSEYYAKAVQWKKDQDEYTQKKEERKDLLCKIAGVTRSSDNDQLYVSCGSISGKINRVGSGETVSIELHNVNIALLQQWLS